jgi:hypothetical protein
MQMLQRREVFVFLRVISRDRREGRVRGRGRRVGFRVEMQWLGAGEGRVGSESFEGRSRGEEAGGGGEGGGRC